ncbi:hypothetical protein OK074_1789 [Actinobacteria bacterium OK074]|nr:hypothetical protein OK074_1789 [Actinobacteria bacterium OK074]
MSTPATAPVPTPVNGRLLGLAHYASRTLLEVELAPVGLGFYHTVALRNVADNGGTAERDSLVGRLLDTVRILDEATARQTVDELTATQALVTPAPGRLGLTDRGRALHEHAQAEGLRIAARLYADIPRAELETAGRVLSLVLERANAELATAV